MDISVHVEGVDKLIREFDRTAKGMEEALDEGCQDAADYLVESIEDKFGVYQPGWEKLKYETVHMEQKQGYGANATKPLVMTSDMMFSFDTKTENRSRKHTVTVTSDDPKLAYHVYGVPSSGVPKRDPVRPTVKEEKDNCLKIIADKIKEVFGK